VAGAWGAAGAQHPTRAGEPPPPRRGRGARAAVMLIDIAVAGFERDSENGAARSYAFEAW